jgi:hypothetical protein
MWLLIGRRFTRAGPGNAELTALGHDRRDLVADSNQRRLSLCGAAGSVGGPAAF